MVRFLPQLPSRHPLGEPVTVVRKIGFAIHMAELINHYRNIWRHLNPNEFEIIYRLESEAEEREILEFAKASGYQANTALSYWKQGKLFQTLVSNQVGTLGNIDVRGHAIPMVAVVGINQVRMMYALGKARWNFSSWNGFYDLALCWGPYHEKNLSKFTYTRKVQVGYPRFDHFFRGEIDRGTVLEELSLDPAKKTVLWLPTWRELSSVNGFSDAIATLKGEYNLIVKVHPGMVLNDPKRLAILRAAGIPWQEETNYDNARLFAIADFVICDYGGSPFGAIYTDKNLLLLNVANAAEDDLTGADSMDVLIRQWIPNVDAEHRMDIPAMLRNPALWEAQRSVRGRLRAELFSPFEGRASQVTADVLREYTSATLGAGPSAWTRGIQNWIRVSPRRVGFKTWLLLRLATWTGRRLR